MLTSALVAIGILRDFADVTESAPIYLSVLPVFNKLRVLPEVLLEIVTSFRFTWLRSPERGLRSQVACRFISRLATATTLI